MPGASVLEAARRRAVRAVLGLGVLLLFVTAPAVAGAATGPYVSLGTRTRRRRCPNSHRSPDRLRTLGEQLPVRCSPRDRAEFVHRRQLWERDDGQHDPAPVGAASAAPTRRSMAASRPPTRL
jgi:hypothetical protein